VSFRSVFEVLNEGLSIKVSPVVDLDLFVEGLKLLLNLILGRGNDELVFRWADIGSVHDKQDFCLSSSVGCGVLNFENAISLMKIDKVSKMRK